jgi:hypothetical protein
VVVGGHDLVRFPVHACDGPLEGREGRGSNGWEKRAKEQETKEKRGEQMPVSKGVCDRDARQDAQSNMEVGWSRTRFLCIVYLVLY